MVQAYSASYEGGACHHNSNGFTRDLCGRSVRPGKLPGGKEYGSYPGGVRKAASRGKSRIYSEIPWEGELPSSLILFSEKEKEDARKPECGIVISADADKQIFPITCFLAPRDLTVGIGSRKGIAREEITRCLTRVLEENGLWEGRIARLASASLKREEPGIQEEALARRVPFLTYTPEELERVPGTFHGSSFVEKTVGVDNVCERAAFWEAAAGNCWWEKEQAAV